MSADFQDPKISDVVLFWEDPARDPLPLLICAVGEGGCVSGVIPYIKSGWKGHENVPYGPKEAGHWGWKSDYYFDEQPNPRGSLP